MLLSVYHQAISIKEHLSTPARILFQSKKKTINIGMKMGILREFYTFKQKNMQFIESNLIAESMKRII